MHWQSKWLPTSWRTTARRRRRGRTARQWDNIGNHGYDKKEKNHRYHQSYHQSYHDDKKNNRQLEVVFPGK